MDESQTNRYHKFAKVYDKMKADHFSTQMTDYTLRLVDRFGIEVHQLLDLCCGTGTACLLFARRGFTVSGLDQSPHMLAVARKKLKGKNVTLYRQSLPKFLVPARRGSRQPRQFDLVTSFFDSLNYLLTPRDLKATFASVHRHLRPGGWFIFDMNTPYALRFLWDGQEHTEVRDDLVTVWRNEYHEKNTSATCHATFLVKRGRHWERFDEAHTERGYSNAEIKRLLREAGFVIKGFYECLTVTRPTKNTDRICVVARRKT